MKRTLVMVIVLAVASIQALFADDTTRAVQQALKDQGFYYGETTGQKNADTTAAIRRFQIRNGLQITGELNKETLSSLGIGAAPPARSTAPKTLPSATPAPSTDLRDDRAENRTERLPAPPAQAYNPQRSTRVPGYAPGPHGVELDTSGVFDGTPYEIAPPDLQRHVIAGAQTLLGRRGFYGSAVDGVFGPGTELAVRAFQSRVGIPPNGQLDMETLAALGLLPGQHAPGIAVPPRRFDRRRPPPRVLPY